MAGTQRKKRGRRREALVHSHLERVSRDLLEDHPDVVKKFIGRNAGIYALYKEDRLYYVGLATGLSGRLKSHKKNRHGKSWDRFSLYLTIKDQHLREIEGLILQIARPKGNKQGGRPVGSKNMRRQIAAAIRLKRRNEMNSLFEAPRKQKNKLAVADEREASLLMRLLPAGARLTATLRSKSFTARARRDGRVRFRGRTYSSLSAAATAAAGGCKKWMVVLAGRTRQGQLGETDDPKKSGHTYLSNVVFQFHHAMSV